MSNVSLEVKDFIAVVDIHREPMNIFNQDLLREVYAAFTAIETRDDVRVVLVKSSVKEFSAGADLRYIEKIADCDSDAQRDVELKPTTDCICGVYNCRFPVVCAVNGLAVGAGAAIAASADVCVASDDARFSVPEVTAGWIGASEFFQLNVPRRLARYYIYTGKPITAKELRAFGGLLDVVPREELEARALQVCRDLVKMPPLAVQYFKACMNHNDDERLYEKYMYEYQYTLRYLKTEDFRESIDAFFHKRKPNFVGR